MVKEEILIERPYFSGTQILVDPPDSLITVVDKIYCPACLVGTGLLQYKGSWISDIDIPSDKCELFSSFIVGNRTSLLQLF